ncbi:MAG: protein jag [Clostridiales bacterium]|nr:protein jag [Clostridiales bacterium]
MDYIEMTGKTINEATEKAMEILGLGYDEIDREILEEPRKGFLGIGAREAKVLVKRAGFDIEKAKAEEAAKAEREAKKAEEAKARAAKKAAAEAAKAAKKAEEEAANAAKKQQKAETKKEDKKEARADKQQKAEKKEARTEKRADKPKKAPAKKENTAAAAKQAPAETSQEEAAPKAEINTEKAFEDASVFLKEVFGAMNLSVETEKQDENGRQLYLNLTGDDMGVIIGKRGQTLDSLQYLTNLVVNKGNSPYVSVHLDTKDYRKKRKETLENLARNLAKKAKHTRRNVTLEPMNPYERRIIHSTLQNDRYVTTFSEGEEPYRHVVISPKYK